MGISKEESLYLVTHGGGSFLQYTKKGGRKGIFDGTMSSSYHGGDGFLGSLELEVERHYFSLSRYSRSDSLAAI